LSAAPVRVVLFDLDGTLIDTARDLAECGNAMRARYGLAPLSGEALRGFIGKGLANFIAMSLEGAAADPEEATRFFEERYFETCAASSRPYPGVIAGLDLLRAAGIALGVVTNKAGRFTEAILERTGVRGRFGVVVSGDTLGQKKPHPEPVLHAARVLGADMAQTLFIGDSGIDVSAARAAGCRVWLVPYGYSEGRDVGTLAADAIIPDIEAAAKSITIRA
jgi:phosphoglycolate phosphatase